MTGGRYLRIEPRAGELPRPGRVRVWRGSDMLAEYGPDGQLRFTVADWRWVCAAPHPHVPAPFAAWSLADTRDEYVTSADPGWVGTVCMIRCPTWDEACRSAAEHWRAQHVTAVTPVD